MTIIKRKSFSPRSDKDAGVVETESYIDLSDMAFEDEGMADAQMLIRVAEIYRYEDLGSITSHVYNGHVVLLDITSIANDDLTLKRVTSDLRNVVRDVNGDVAGVGKNLLMVTPSGVRIDRNKLRGGF
ncbi:MAG: cell division protein SepF [Thermoplasmata archaeon]|nr:cell division protein SepF [Thermoplasmata archaeon]